MFFLIVYILIVIIEMIVAAFFMVFTLLLLYSSLKGSPYVPTRKKEIDIILQESNLRKNSYFLDLGCGDGRIVRTAVQKYEVKGLGIDVNPLLITISNIYAKLSKLQNIKFRTQNLFDPKLTEEFNKADFIYLFLMPKLLDKLLPILKKNCQKGCMIISHGFKIEALDKKLQKKVERKPFPTYFYKL